MCNTIIAALNLAYHHLYWALIITGKESSLDQIIRPEVHIFSRHKIWRNPCTNKKALMKIITVMTSLRLRISHLFHQSWRVCQRFSSSRRLRLPMPQFRLSGTPSVILVTMIYLQVLSMTLMKIHPSIAFHQPCSRPLLIENFKSWPNKKKTAKKITQSWLKIRITLTSRNILMSLNVE